MHGGRVYNPEAAELHIMLYRPYFKDNAAKKQAYIKGLMTEAARNDELIERLYPDLVDKDLYEEAEKVENFYKAYDYGLGKRFYPADESLDSASKRYRSE